MIRRPYYTIHKFESYQGETDVVFYVLEISNHMFYKKLDGTEGYVKVEVRKDKRRGE